MIVEVDSLYKSGSFFHLVFFLLHYHKNFSKFHSETNLPSSLRRKNTEESYIQNKSCAKKNKKTGIRIGICPYLNQNAPNSVPINNEVCCCKFQI